MSGAAPLSAELTRQFCERLPGASIGQGYGMTETATTITFPRIDMQVCTFGSGGQLLQGNVCRVLKPDGTYAGYNEPGELLIKGPTLALCYLNNEQAYVVAQLKLDNMVDGVTARTRPFYNWMGSLIGGSALVTRSCSMSKSRSSCLIV
jgi:4-coumarate--CoA ligase